MQVQDHLVRTDMRWPACVNPALNPAMNSRGDLVVPLREHCLCHQTNPPGAWCLPNGMWEAIKHDRPYHNHGALAGRQDVDSTVYRTVQ